MGKLLLMIGLLLIIGCVNIYDAPSTTEPIVSTNHSISKETLMEVSQKVILLDGYRITYANKTKGVISTAPRDIKLTPQYADCGSSMGVDYLKDKSTITGVSIDIFIDANQIRVKANIKGEYKPGPAGKNFTLGCVSMGVIEKEILSKIKNQAGLK